MPEYIKHLNSVLREEKAYISAIVLTHWHHDHVGGVKDVLKINKNKGYYFAFRKMLSRILML